MGLVYDGIHKELALKLRDEYHLSFLVETGTYTGRTAIWASKHFVHVSTVELSGRFFNMATLRYGHKTNIKFYFGDSRELLPKIIDELPGPRPALFWLDAHWSQDLKYPRPKVGECPLLAELDAVVADGRNHVIMIDDARQFIGCPPKPHIASQWPTLEDIRNKLSWFSISVQDDVIIAIPRDLT